MWHDFILNKLPVIFSHFYPPNVFSVHQHAQQDRWAQQQLTRKQKSEVMKRHLYSDREIFTQWDSQRVDKMANRTEGFREYPLGMLKCIHFKIRTGNLLAYINMWLQQKLSWGQCRAKRCFAAHIQGIKAWGAPFWRPWN